jgi:ABC-type branched-subunit amino acid transport system substrate-binding protein
LLPRSGKLASIADAQLEGIEVGLTLLSATGEAPAVTWLDPGIGEAGIQRAGSAAIRDGIDTLIGPVGHDAVALAQDHLGGLTLVVPGEVAGRRPAADAAARAVTIPSAATLEARVAALSVTARAVGATRAIVLTPASSYGRRAASAAKLSLSESGFKSTEFIEYPATATSFSEFTDALRGADARVAILVFDAMPRVEAVLRQLRRDGIVGGARGALVASTGEGFDPARLTAARGVFEGVWLAPPAFASPEDAFARAFQTRFGRGPSDQAVLAWRALLWATGHPWTGAERATSSTAVGDVDGSAGLHPPMASAPALVGRVKGDRLVPQ